MISRNFLLITVSILISSCQSSQKTAHDNSTKALVDPKYSLAKDRSELEELRQAIPTDIKRANDEKALKAEWMGELKFAPEVVREKMSHLVQKKRDLFNKDMTKKREEFNKTERKNREAFLKNLEEDRKDFLGHKADRDKRNEFFENLDEKRREYFSEQKDKREEFESETREERKNYEDYVKEKQDEFNAELIEYSIRWKEKNKDQSR